MKKPLKKDNQDKKRRGGLAERKNKRYWSDYVTNMSMLNFYINRTGKNLKPTKKRILEQAKTELRKLFKT